MNFKSTYLPSSWYNQLSSNKLGTLMVTYNIPHFQEHLVEEVEGFLAVQQNHKTFCQTSILLSFHRLTHPEYFSMQGRQHKLKNKQRSKIYLLFS